MRRLLKEKNSSRVFESTSRWNEIQYTVISANNENAKYADNYGKGDKKLFLTYIRFMTKVVPIKKFSKLSDPIKLEGGVVLTQVNEDGTYFLEEDKKNDRVRVYWEVKE